MDQREMGPDFEEAMRTSFAGMMRNVWTAMPMRATEDSADGHTASFQVTVKRAVQDLSTGEITYVDHPETVDVPVQHPSGGSVASTYPTKKGDEILGVVASRNVDGWHQNGDTQPPVDNRMHHLGDTFQVRGHRSDPNKLQQVAADSVQHRSVDKKHVHEVHPQNGVTTRAVDPSTAPASESFDPFTQATKFFEHQAHPTGGVLGRAVDGGTQHDHGVTHDSGPFMRAANALHSVLCDPSSGPSLNALNSLHSVLASPTLGALLSGMNGEHTVTAGPAGVILKSATGISLQAPPGSISFPAGSVSGGAVQGGGDISGNLDQAQVVSLSHVNASDLKVAASDSAAAAAGVALYGLYINQSVSSGRSVLCVRMT